MDASLDLLGAGQVVDVLEEHDFSLMAPRRTLSQEMEQMDLTFLINGDAPYIAVDVGMPPSFGAALAASSLPGVETGVGHVALPRTPLAVVPVTPPSAADVPVFQWDALDAAAVDSTVRKASVFIKTPAVEPLAAQAPAPAPEPFAAPMRCRSARAGGKLRAARSPPTPRSGRSGLHLRPSMLTVQQLREELRVRGLVTSGHKPELVARLETELTEPSAQKTAMSALRRHKRPKSKREPQAEDFDTDKAYHDAWTRWREWRDDNNRSVKRSRQRKRVLDRLETKQAAVQEHENSVLEDTVSELKRQVTLLKRAVCDPTALSGRDRRDLSCILDAHDFAPLP